MDEARGVAYDDNFDELQFRNYPMHDRLGNRIRHVSATRKSFRNQIKNFWWRKGKQGAIENPNGYVL
ncbi:hypothetical protein ACS0TY_006794 [Phlomoides rotata]